MSKYEQLSVICNCSHTSLQEAALRLGPSFVYTLSVATGRLLATHTMLKQFGADTASHPLSPYINMSIDTDLKGEEWYLSANGKSVGSQDF